MLSRSLLRKNLGGKEEGSKVMLFGFFAESKSEGLVFLQDKSEAHFALWTGLRSSSLSVLWICCVEGMEIWQKKTPLVMLLVLRNQKGWMQLGLNLD